MSRAGSKRNIEMSSVYADHSLPWSARLLIYRRAVQGWLVFFLLSAAFNYLISATHSFAYALSLMPLALILVPTLVFDSPALRGFTIIFLLTLGFVTQSLNTIREPQGIMLSGLVLVTAARLGWFRENGWFKILVMVPLACASLYLSTAEMIVTPSSDVHTFWGAMNQLAFVVVLLYQLFYLAWFPDEYTRRKLRATEMERDIYKHELRHAHSNKTAQAPQGTIAQHLDAIDTMASDDLPAERADEYHERTDAVRHTISYLVRKHFSILMDKTINRVRR